MTNSNYVSRCSHSRKWHCCKMAESTTKRSGCIQCTQAVHINIIQNQDVKCLKLFEQARCAFCWRPLKINLAWPGPRESQRPPFGNGTLLVAQCGHIFHGCCASKSSKCKTCFATIQKLIPLHYQEQKCEDAKPPDIQEKSAKPPNVQEKSAKPPNIQENQEKAYPKEGSNIVELIANLNEKINLISDEIVSLRRQLVPKPKWR